MRLRHSSGLRAPFASQSSEGDLSGDATEQVHQHDMDAEDGDRDDDGEGPANGCNEEDGGAPPRNQKTDLLAAALAHVPRLGWSVDALRSGAKDLGLSPAAIGMLPRGEAELVQHFEEQCNAALARELEMQQEHLQQLNTEQRLAKAVRLRLEMTAPYIKSWPQALSVQAQPGNCGEALRARAVLMDEIWFAAGDRATDMTWYAKRASLGMVFSATELYMLTDTSPGWEDTWAFLDRRLQDAMHAGTHVEQAAGTLSDVVAGLGAQFSTVAQAASVRRYP